MDLTWFERAVSPEAVAESLRSEIPEFRSGTGQLLGCRVTRLRSTEADPESGTEAGWTATYLLQVEGDDGPTTIAAHGTLVSVGAPDPTADPSAGIFGDGWSCWLPDLRLHLRTWSADAALPGIQAITRDDSARALLEPLLRRPGATDDLHLSACTATIATYKPGVRATVCCDLEYSLAPAPAHWPRAVIAKVHRPEEGRALHDSLEALWSSPLRSNPSVSIAEPLGYVDALGISVQSYLAHDQTLKDLLAESFSGPDNTPQLLEALLATANGVAALHTSGITGGVEVRWEDELAAVEAKHEKLTAVVPWLADLTEGSSDRLRAAGARREPDPFAPAHGSLRPAQVLLLDGGGLGLIDFDKAARAEPGVDIGLFLTKLRHTAVNKTGDLAAPDPSWLEEPSARVDSVAEVFLDAYREKAPVTLERIHLWESLELFSLVLSAAKKLLPDRAQTCAAMLERHLRAHDL